MMTSLAQNFPPGGIQQHPGVPPGHPMAGPHNPGQQMQGGMPPQMHMGVSGPGPQVNQQGAMMGGMPPGVGGPSAHALQHLGPGQQQAQFLQQQQMCKYISSLTCISGTRDDDYLANTCPSSRQQSPIAATTNATADDGSTATAGGTSASGVISTTV